MNSSRNSTSRLFLLAIAVFSFHTLFAQITSSPYSRYGVGDVGGKGFTQSFGMGGTYIAMQNDTLPMLFINQGNPAALSNCRFVTAELGANYQRVNLESATNQKSINSASLGYVALAFPFKKWWGSSVGLMPFSAVGYKVSDAENIPNVGAVNFLYEGSGGINQVYWGNGIRPFYPIPRNFLNSDKFDQLQSRKNADGSMKDCQTLYRDNNRIRKTMNRRKLLGSFSMGANASYLFGNMEASRRSIFPGSYLGFNTRGVTSTRVDGLYFDYGMQMAYFVDSVATKNYTDTSRTRLNECWPVRYRALKEKVRVSFGFTFAAESQLPAVIDSVSYSYFNNSLGYEIIKDTIENSQGNKGNLTLPMSFGAGVAFKKGYRWLAAADFSVQNWSTYQAFGQTQALRNSMRASLGGQFVNSLSVGDPYYERIHYRVGLRYMQTALELKNTPLNEYALSLGFGFPVIQNKYHQFSMVNLSVEFGRRGTTTNGLIRENFLRATIGFTINDITFFQRSKFD